MAHQPQPQYEFHYQRVELLKTESLGIGSYGAVCKAMCDDLPCAAKILHPTLFQFTAPGATSVMQKFEQECHLLSAIKHPHIVQYLGMYRDPASRLPVLLMELMDESLTRFLERSHEPLPYHTEVNLCHDIVLALSYLHSNGIVHRDLSSNNVLLIAGSRAKVTDFGVAKLFDMNNAAHLTPLTLCPGTMVYMPPEALQRRPVYTDKLDSFSLGVLCVQIMTRQLPDPGDHVTIVEDSRYPTGTIQVPIPEIERRQSHLSLINPAHPLLRVALNCLKDKDRERPSTQELCHHIAGLKTSPQFTGSVQQNPTGKLARELQQQNAQVESIRTLQRQLHTKDDQLRALNNQLRTKDDQLEEKEQEIQQQQQQMQQKETAIAAHHQEIQQLGQQLCTKDDQLQRKEKEIQQRQQQMLGLQNLVTATNDQLEILYQKLTTKDEQLTDKDQQLADKNQQLASKDHQLQQKEAVIATHRQEIQQLRQQLESSVQVTAELQQNLLEKEETIQDQQKQIQDQLKQIQDQQKQVLKLQQQLKRRSREQRLSQKKMEGSSAASRGNIRLRWRDSERVLCAVEMYGSVAAVDESRVYFRCGVRKEVYSYDASSKKWSELPECPNYGFSLAMVNGFLTAIGGKTPSDNKASKDEVTNSLLSLIDNKWTEGFPPMPTKRWLTAAVCSGKSLVVAGGLIADKKLSTVEVMDTETPQWSTASSLPHLLSEASATLCGSRLYVLGGFDQSQQSNSVFTCSLAALLQSCQPPFLGPRRRPSEQKVWHQLTDIPVTLSTCASLLGQLLAVGGCDLYDKKATAIHMYNTATNSWEVISHMATPRSQCLVAVLPRNKLMVVGGDISNKCVEIAHVV